MPKAPTLIDEILGGIEPIRKGPAGWFAILPLEVQEELATVRKKFAGGGIAATKTSVAKSIHAALAARGLISVSWREVVRWLGDA